MQLFKTVKDSYKRLNEENTTLLSKKIKNVTTTVDIDTKETYQTIIGFGGGMTESSAYALSKLNKEQREILLRKYYDSEYGIGYTLGRTHINSCDFSLKSYTYVKEGDMTLDTFSLQHDKRYVIPLIKDILKITNNNLTILASPWSPPGYMKTNNKMKFGGKLKPEFRQLWADYYVKYIKHMKEEGINIWGVSVQNEPAAVQKWESCIYSADQERTFIKNYLGPTLKNEGLEDIKIIIWDHNRNKLISRVSPILNDSQASKYIWGSGIHWYVGENFESTTMLHKMFKNKHIIFTEGCNEGGVKPGAWYTGERYGRNIIGDLNNFVEAWFDWNIFLDENGGPNHARNFCDAPIIINTKYRMVYYNSSYYYIGHFSKFIKPYAIRIKSSITSKNKKVYSLACINKDSSKVVVIMNESKKFEYVQLNIDKNNQYYFNLEPHSILTFIV